MKIFGLWVKWVISTLDIGLRFVARMKQLIRIRFSRDINNYIVIYT